ncbi:ISL3 family transposase [Bifidobacterium crudilactis]|uniref:ISL3 family transposase n=1 Tax=Bifidobacterium crudilactis TaxID=327277 RepID=UPI0026494F71|nr:ISL3 family transposase [Bifidobacterium crudilactis]MDN5973373.1 ISL3 family transposase [Bifidobacterium crudilactis]MDN5973377.1 ISL3 family transposase [Bifidobacterium crudilactis]MDN6654927.1 ISL3 family transposase [Bifidobacterium crudilactis]MDN6773296.1 ISL3 family transposase [Bifidobacterium crudilactis]MDN6773300.1 ISL3 family transposase [Bifidobacterium crudilactis]
MDTANLFTAALQLPDPWKVGAVEFRDVGEGGRELHMRIGFEPGSRFPCPQDGCVQADCVVHDTRERVWRHLDFFQHKAFIHAAVPRVICPKHGARTVPVPWARPGSGFTLLFEAWAVELAKHMPVSVLAGLVGESDTRLWRFIAHYVDEARRLLDYTGVEAIGIDETSRKGHKYITVAADLAEHDVINVTGGKDSSTVERFARDFMDHNGVPEYVRLVTCDMSLGFQKGVREHLPNARRIVDKFHVIKHANEAVDEVRKTEGRGNTLLKKTKYLWLSNERSLSPARLETKRSLIRQRLKTARACQMREALQDIYQDSQSPAEAYSGLTRLCSWMMHSRLEPMKRSAALIRRHWHEIMAYFTHPYTNAILEGLNSIIQNIKRRARGLRNMDYFATMIYLNCSNLDLKAVTSN